jgi:hypothetical protein
MIGQQKGQRHLRVPLLGGLDRPRRQSIEAPILPDYEVPYAVLRDVALHLLDQHGK